MIFFFAYKNVCRGFQWARELGQLCTSKVRVPVYPAEHFYVITNPMPDIHNNLPCVRDFDSATYIREYNGGFLVGAFEPEAKPAFMDYRTIPENWKYKLPDGWKHFGKLCSICIFTRYTCLEIITIIIKKKKSYINTPSY